MIYVNNLDTPYKKDVFYFKNVKGLGGKLILKCKSRLK